MKRLNEQIVCKDGFTMSVQANESAYCTPRNSNISKYTAVEVGYPSDIEDLLMEWAESPDKPTATIYGYVPATQITLVVAKHGGIVSGELPPGIPYLTAT